MRSINDQFACGFFRDVVTVRLHVDLEINIKLYRPLGAHGMDRPDAVLLERFVFDRFT